MEQKNVLSFSEYQVTFSKLVAPFLALSSLNKKVLTASWFITKLGPMIGIGDDKELYLLEFFDCRCLEKEIKKLVTTTSSILEIGSSKLLESIEQELILYFDGKLRKFTTPLHIAGTAFQRDAWNALLSISYGQTRSYADQSRAIGRPTACRAVANANRANQLSIVIPCHRIIKSGGKLGGYAGGLNRKQWLLNHEKHNA